MAIPSAQEAHEQSDAKNGYLFQLKNRINKALNAKIQAGEYLLQWEFMITGPGIREMYTDYTPSLMKYYRAKGYRFCVNGDAYEISW